MKNQQQQQQRHKISTGVLLSQEYYDIQAQLNTTRMKASARIKFLPAFQELARLWSGVVDVRNKLNEQYWEVKDNKWSVDPASPQYADYMKEFMQLADEEMEVPILNLPDEALDALNLTGQELVILDLLMGNPLKEKNNGN